MYCSMGEKASEPHEEQDYIILIVWCVWGCIIVDLYRQIWLYVKKYRSLCSKLLTVDDSGY